ncbi:MAG: MurR/RpiR family transcriptional regulator [Motiliproteus sp.]|nr:MurR/RpiR family transcriptional regulator [Motiliproteus sp.]MCW9051302.1 MurR/RpiR family transcriptional regulator [Motiliproteus sp.]
MSSADQPSAEELLEHLSQLYPDLSPQLKKAAAYLMENRVEFALQPIRKTADAVDVAPSTFMRLAKTLGFDRYDSLRQVFQRSLQEGQGNFSSRADSLIELGGRCEQQGVVAEMAGCTYRGIEELFGEEMVSRIKQAAELILASPQVHVLGLRDSYSCAYHLAYVGSVAMSHIRLVRAQEGSLFTELARIDKGDLLIAFAFHPYTRETIEASRIAIEQGAQLICITDSLRSPLVPGAKVVLEVQTETPNFFPSIVTSITLIEALLAVCVARGGKKMLTKIRRFDQQMEDLGGYYTEE